MKVDGRKAGAQKGKREYTCQHCSKVMFVNGGSFKSHLRYCGGGREALFWSKVDKNGPNGCWLFMGYRDKDNYGDMYYDRKHIQSHRLSWRLLRGDPGKLDVLHKCDNPPCCNPEHLYLGTDKENARDRVRFGKQQRGENVVGAIMTEESVRQLRQDRLASSDSYYKLGTKYGISYSQARAICNGTRWAHVK